jgi:hypothetical protein
MGRQEDQLSGRHSSGKPGKMCSVNTATGVMIAVPSIVAMGPVSSPTSAPERGEMRPPSRGPLRKVLSLDLRLTFSDHGRYLSENAHDGARYEARKIQVTRPVDVAASSDSHRQVILKVVRLGYQICATL